MTEPDVAAIRARYEAATNAAEITEMQDSLADIPALLDRLAALEQEGRTRFAAMILTQHEAGLVQQRASAAVAQSRRLREALRFYADVKNYEREYYSACCEGYSPVDRDKGELAQNALARRPCGWAITTT